ncbi:MAG: protein kinase [Candidatus Faecousia sp.]|nr:protein kinase [Candidatus Faecousia sp.]
MSEPTLISPLLDGFTMGQPISEHDGVSCCPAIKEDTDKKYIVKIITIPATQTQMDALLLAGAYKDPADAMEYYRMVGEDVQKEAELLKQLSQQEGFLSYEGWQMAPITRKRLGYQVYLVGSYKRSLDKHLRRSPVTQLEAMNLGLDLCSALTACRKAGSLYVALKPSNIFVSDRKQYRIGDLGFISLDALSYTALPKKYQSPYTPPELFDPMAALNLTADTYAVGLILYQLYNDGQLPFREKAPVEALPSPVNADYELAEIIMKAIDPDPAKRWDDPAELGKALASYMQRNAVNDVPITHVVPLESVAVAAPETAPIGEPAEAAPAAEPEFKTETVSAESVSAPETEEVKSPEETPEAEPAQEIFSASGNDDVTAQTPVPESPESVESPAQTEELPAEPEEDVSSSESEMPVPEGPYDDFTGILAKAEDLIQHEAPEGVVLPDVPEPPDPFAFAKEDSEDIDDSDIPVDPVMEEEGAPAPKKKKKGQKKYADPKYKRRTKRLISALTFLLALCLAGLTGFWYYQNIYLQAINRILINGTRDQLTVIVDTDAQEALLSVTCSDNYGNSQSQSLSGGTAVFTDLQPSTLYTIQLDIDGFHKLVGKTSDIFTTDATTNILSFTSAAGTEDGSVVLNFAVEGEEPEQWILHYAAENEEAREETFEGHSVSISGLTVGKTYTFTLDAGDSLTLGGEKSLQFVATRLIVADNLALTSSSDGEITVHWNTPGDVLVDSWTVRCYSEGGYDEKQTVTDSEAVFIGIDPASSYTVEVVASGMTQPARASITANPIRVSGLSVDDSQPRSLTVNWDYTGNKPDGGWLLIYTVDGGGKSVVKCDQPQALIAPKIPGAKYAMTLQAADGTTVLGGSLTYSCPEAAAFNQFEFSAENVEAKLLRTPNQAKWYCENVDASDYTDTFVSGESISIAVRNSKSFYLPGTEVEILYVIRDAYGNVLPDYVAAQKVFWKNIWAGGDARCGEFTIPNVPESAGSYELSLIVDGMEMAKLPFTIQ